MGDIIDKNAAAYERDFQFVPSFRAGVHGGKVVAGECGDSRMEISYFGDTVNTAARVQGLCKETGRPLVVSGDLMDQIALPDGLEKVSLGSYELRGKKEKMEVFGVAVRKDNSRQTHNNR